MSPQWTPHYVPEDTEAMRQENYEASVVKYILKKQGWQARERELLKYSRQAGADDLTLEALADLTDFPLRLRTKKLKHITPDLLLSMQVRPTKTPIFEVFAELVQENPVTAEAGRLGLVFAWPTWSTYVLFHLWDTTIHRRGARWVWYPYRRHQPHILETLDSFLEATKAE